MPGFAAYIVEIVLPVLHESLGQKRSKKTILVVLYAKRKGTLSAFPPWSSAAMNNVDGLAHSVHDRHFSRS
jgi:hypothetical protein